MVRPVCYHLLRFVWLAFALVPVLAGAQGALSSVPPQWRCWMSTGERLACVLDGAPVAGLPGIDPLAVMTSTATPSASAATPASAPRPSSRRELPPIVARLRDQPQSLAGQVISIPIYAASDDWPWITTLARAVLCGASAACQVRVGASLSEAIRDGLDTDQVFIGPELGALDLAAQRR